MSIEKWRVLKNTVLRIKKINTNTKRVQREFKENSKRIQREWKTKLLERRLTRILYLVAPMII